MKHIKALLIKLVIVTAALWLSLGLIYGVDFGEIFTMSLVITGIAYIVGDLLVLPPLGNGIATLSDFGLSFFTLWLLIESYGLIVPEIRASLIGAGFVAIGEIFFHRYMKNNILEEERSDGRFINRHEFQTEFAEEFDDDFLEDK